MVQLQAFSYSRIAWLLGYIVLIALVVIIFIVFFFPQNFLQFGPYIHISNWAFIVASFIIVPVGAYLQNHKQKQTGPSWR